MRLQLSSVGAHEKTHHLLRQELTAFEAAIWGQNGIVNHALHWHGFTRVLNTLVPTMTVPAMKYYCLIMVKESNRIYGSYDHILFVCPTPSTRCSSFREPPKACDKITLTWARKTCLT